jgi:hypothetical protein
MAREETSAFEACEETGELVAFISDLQAMKQTKTYMGTLYIALPQDGCFVPLSQWTPDYHGQGSDVEIAGWKYTRPKDGQKFLVIND